MSDTPETDTAISDGVEMLTNQSDSVALYQKLCDAVCEIQGLRRERDEARHKLELCMAANSDVARIAKERDEAREAFKIVYNERVQMELERNEWKNKAYSHATDYTLMEAKCFRLEQQLKEYDKLKS